MQWQHIKCGWDTPATGSGILKSGQILAHRATISSSMAKEMTLQDSGYRICPACHPQGLCEVVAYQRLGVVVALGFSIPKFPNIHACRATTRSWTVKGMTRGHSAHQVGLVRDPLGLSNCSGGLYQRSEIPLRRSEIPEYLWPQGHNQ